MAGCVWCCSSVVAVLAVVLGCVEALLRWQVRTASADAPRLAEPDTFDEANITRDFFYSEYVMKKRPVKIRLARPESWSQSDFKQKCNLTRRLNLMSNPTYSVYKKMSETWWLSTLFDWAMLLLGRWTTLEHEATRRTQVPIQDYLVEAEQHIGGPEREFPIQMPLLLQRILPDYVTMVLETWSRPVYLHDKPIKVVACEWLLDHYHLPKLILPTWLYWGRIEKVNKEQFEQEPKFYMGKAHTKSYPLHLHLQGYQEDFAMVTLQGRKRYAIFHPNQSDNLAPLPVGYGHMVFTIDPFAPDLVHTPRYKDAVGWAGTIEAGEMLYVPGDWIHGMENFDFKQLTVAMRFHMRSHTDACPKLQSRPEAECAANLGMDLPGPGSEPPTIDEYLQEMQHKIGIGAVMPLKRSHT